MAKRQRKKRSADDIAEENSFLKMKMLAEFGGDFMEDEKVPPEVENEFLKQVINFQKQQNSAKTTTVYEYIGSPEYNHLSDLSEKELKVQLKKLMSLMRRKQVVLEFMSSVTDKEIYRFITEELFKHRMDDIKVKGWINHFVYEDFHPNAELEIKTAVHYLILYLFDKSTPLFAEHFNEEMKDHLGLGTDAFDIDDKVQEFKSRYNNVRLINYDFLTLQVDKESGIAHVQCQITYKVQSEVGKRFKRQTTTLDAQLSIKPDAKGWWLIDSIVWSYEP